MELGVVSIAPQLTTNRLCVYGFELRTLLPFAATAAPPFPGAGGPQRRSERPPLHPCHPSPQRHQAGEFMLLLVLYGVHGGSSGGGVTVGVEVAFVVDFRRRAMCRGLLLGRSVVTPRKGGREEGRKEGSIESVRTQARKSLFSASGMRCGPPDRSKYDPPVYNFLKVALPKSSLLLLL